MTADLAGQVVRHLRIPFDDARYLPPFDVATSHTLYRALLGPVESELAPVRHLITVPTGPLPSLPFGVLVPAPPPRLDGSAYTGVPWLAARSAPTLAPPGRRFCGPP